jgi:hypothetical protein
MIKQPHKLRANVSSGGERHETKTFRLKTIGVFVITYTRLERMKIS